MIIECPACQSRYRIREEKLPAGGGNIKCPNCAHVFFVSMPASTSQMGASQTGSSTPSPAPQMPANATLMMGMAPPVTEGARSTGPNSAVRRWKIKNSVGLVYDFSDTDSLRRWLQARDSLDGLTASSDAGVSWGPLDGFEELNDVRPASRKTALAMSAITAGLDPRQNVSSPPPPPPNPEALREQAQARLSQARQKRSDDSAKLPREVASGGTARQTDAGAKGAKKQGGPAPGKLLRHNEEQGSSARMALAGFVLVLALGALAWGLKSAGMFPFANNEPSTSMPPSDSAPTTSPLLEPGGGAPDADAGPAPRRLTDRDRAVQALDRAAASMSQGDTQGAIGHLERAAFLDPENTELACQLAVLYLRENRTEEAAGARARCEGTPEGGAAPEDGAPVQDPNAGAGTAEPAAIDPAAEATGEAAP